MGYAFGVAPGSRVHLSQYDPDYTADLSQEKGQAEFEALNAELVELQADLYASRGHSVLIVLQGMDSSGKDGAIRNVLRNTIPQGCRVDAFKKPTEEDLSHDFLWRIHRAAPAKGMIGVFNRSHYEDVVTVRVHGLLPPDTWLPRYRQINDFERMLREDRTLLLKFYLHISKEEQERRLFSRERKKAWKLSEQDWREHGLWNDYMDAYSEALSRCSTIEAPWYVIPANHKWFRNLAIADTVVRTMRRHDKDWTAALEEINLAHNGHTAAVGAKG